MRYITGVQVLQHWDGVVEDVGESSIWVRLLDRTDPTRPEIAAEVPLARLPASELPYVALGAYFTWKVIRPEAASEDYAENQIAFSRETWTQEELDAAADEAARISAALGWFADTYVREPDEIPTEIETCGEGPAEP